MKFVRWNGELRRSIISPESKTGARESHEHDMIVHLE